jgi:hypothetical protein
MKSPTLEKADACINGERQDQYGNPEDSFALIAEYWTVYMGDMGPVCTPKDVAIMMALFKIARMSGQKWAPDNAVDACGYLAILNDRLKPAPQPGTNAPKEGTNRE